MNDMGLSLCNPGNTSGLSFLHTSPEELEIVSDHKDPLNQSLVNTVMTYPAHGINDIYRDPSHHPIIINFEAERFGSVCQCVCLGFDRLLSLTQTGWACSTVEVTTPLVDQN